MENIFHKFLVIDFNRKINKDIVDMTLWEIFEKPGLNIMPKKMKKVDLIIVNLKVIKVMKLNNWRNT